MNYRALNSFNMNSSINCLAPLAHKQRGIMGIRPAIIVAVLIGVLVVPLWWSKKKRDAAKAKEAAVSIETAAQQTAAAAAAPGVASLDRFGLSFGHGTPPGNAVNAMYSSCAGLPLDMGNPGSAAVAAVAAPVVATPTATTPTAATSTVALATGTVPAPAPAAAPVVAPAPAPSTPQCNPVQGDTACRTALPVLCVLKDGSASDSVGVATDTKIDGSSPTYTVSALWAGGTLGATAPVAGFVLGSLAEANARCTKELGSGWRMATVLDSTQGGSLLGKRGQGLVQVQTRHWVANPAQKSNCWDAS
jgi:hypothetical protein